MSDSRISSSSRGVRRWLRPVVYAAITLLCAMLLSPLGQKLTSSSRPASSSSQPQAIMDAMDHAPRQPGAAVLYIWHSRPAMDEAAQAKWLAASRELLDAQAALLVQMAGEHDRTKLRTGVMTMAVQRADDASANRPPAHFQMKLPSLEPPRDDLFVQAIDQAMARRGQASALTGRQQAEALQQAYLHAMSAGLSQITLVWLSPDAPDVALQAMAGLIEQRPDDTRVVIPARIGANDAAALSGRVRQRIEAIATEQAD